MLIVSGIIKTVKNVYMPDMNNSLVLWATWTHNISFVLFIFAIAAHLGALVIKPNRPMVRGILTGRVRLDYARHRHPLWLDEKEGMVNARIEQAAEGEEAEKGTISQPVSDLKQENVIGKAEEDSDQSGKKGKEQQP
jgi:cytochrome b subunit of formate dehydrogenase